MVQIGDDVDRIFKADRKADRVRRDPGGKLFFFGELLMGRRCRMDDECFCISNVCQKRDELDIILHGDRSLKSSFDPEGKKRSAGSSKVFFAVLFRRMSRKARVSRPIEVSQALNGESAAPRSRIREIRILVDTVAGPNAL